MRKPVIIVPTNRSQELIDKFFSAWEKEMVGTKVVLVEDRPKKLLRIKRMPGVELYHYCWADIKKDLGKDSWIIPFKTDCVRSYGFLKALSLNPLFLLTVDDDTRPFEGLVKKHYENLFFTRVNKHWMISTLRLSKGLTPRGLYADDYGVGISHGGWVGVPDLNAVDSIASPNACVGKYDFNEAVVPPGMCFPVCGMNLAWRPELTKSFYFGLQGGAYPVDRCGDIWAGMKAQTDAGRQGYWSVCGAPYVIHEKASNSWNNLAKEANVERYTQHFVHAFTNAGDITTTLMWDVDDIKDPVERKYFKRLILAYRIWDKLVDKFSGKKQKTIKRGV